MSDTSRVKVVVEILDDRFREWFKEGDLVEEKGIFTIKHYTLLTGSMGLSGSQKSLKVDFYPTTKEERELFIMLNPNMLDVPIAVLPEYYQPREGAI